VVDCDMCPPTVSIYSALTERLFTGRDMLGECLGGLKKTKLLHYYLAEERLPRAGRMKQSKRRERGSPSVMLFCLGRIVCSVDCIQLTQTQA